MFVGKQVRTTAVRQGPFSQHLEHKINADSKQFLECKNKFLF